MYLLASNYYFIKYSETGYTVVVVEYHVHIIFLELNNLSQVIGYYLESVILFNTPVPF